MQSTIEFTRANIMAENNISLVDADEETGVELFCYNSCSKDDSYFVKQSRGLVFKGETLVMKALPYTDEYTSEDKNLDNLLSNMSEWKFFPSYEGALLRMFNVSGKWYLSTHRKLDAFRSKWSCKDSFGILFSRALENEVSRNQEFSSRLGAGDDIVTKFQNSLDPEKQYMFLLRNTFENRIVCTPPTTNEPNVFHVGTFISKTLSFEDNCGIPKPEQLHFNTLSELRTFVDNSDPHKIQGVICFGQNNKNIKVLHEKYLFYFNVRGNEPSIKFRYLQVRQDETMVDRLRFLYPEFVKVFEYYEATLHTIAQRIYKAYVDRFIRKHYVVVSQEEFKVVSECHTWHQSDKVRNRISLEKVKQVLNTQTPVALNHMIRNYSNENSFGYPIIM